MKSSIWGRAVLMGLALTSSLAQALTFAVNEGVTYRVGNDEIRAKYAAISVDLSKVLGQPVRVEPVGDYNTLRKGLADKSYDLAIVHPAHISIGAAHRELTSIRTERPAGNTGGNLGGNHQLARGSIPDFHPTITPTGREASPIPREAREHHRPLRREGEHGAGEAVAGDVPDADRFVVPAGHQQGSVRAERCDWHIAGMM